MYIIIDCDDCEHLRVVSSDTLTDDPTYGLDGYTLTFETWEEADEYAEKYCGEYRVTEIDEL